MSKEFDPPRAFASIFLASFVPGITAFAMSSEPLPDFSGFVLGFSIFFLFSAPLVLIVGLPSIFLAMRIRFGPTVIPLVIGPLIGFLFAKFQYAPGTPLDILLQWALMGFLTAGTAAVVYFFPFKRAVVEA